MDKKTEGNDKEKFAIHPQTGIGHVHLKVSNLERSVKFYEEMFGFHVVTRFGESAAFLAAGNYHHHLGLNTWESQGGAPPARGTTGLYHFAILVPSRKELARALKHLIERGAPLDGAADHGVSESIYLHDPDFNGIEIYRDRPREEWPLDDEGNIEMFTNHLDLEKLLSEA